MSEVFVSYARSTVDDAQRIAAVLDAMGYSTWRDDQLPPHRPYAEVIQERLEQAKAVIVLWSQEAVQSQWVRSEANRAREENKLVQVSVDGTAPPMPFDQIHCAELKGWDGDPDAPDWRRVAQSLGALVGRPPGDLQRVGPGVPGAEAPGRRAPAPRVGLRPNVRIIALVGGLILAIGAAGLWLMKAPGGKPSDALKVAVLPFETLSSGEEVRYFADSLQDEVVGALSGQQIEPVSPSASASLRGPDATRALERLGARLVVDGTARRDGDAMRVRVHVDDPRSQTTLWSREFTAPASDASILQSRVAHRTLVVLGCSRRALQPRTGLADPKLVSSYLHACDVFADWDVHTGYDQKGQAEYAATIRSITQQAPDFAEAQYLYAMESGLGAKGRSDPSAAAMRREAETHVKRGVALAPGSPMAFAVRMLLLPPRDWAGREAWLRKAVAADPAASMPNFWLGSILAETGRVREGIQFTRRSAAGAMVYDWGIFDSAIACGGDDPAQALNEIRTARKFIPESVFAQDIEAVCLSYLDRWDEVHKVIAGPPAPGAETPYRGAAIDAVATAARTGHPTDRENARRLVLAWAKQGPIQLTSAVMALSREGFVDDAFALAERYDPDTTPGLSPNLFLFTPPAKNLRRDARFMRLAARIGLVDYWRTSGHWPDFCSDEDLPYDCRAEAAKLSSAPAARLSRATSAPGS